MCGILALFGLSGNPLLIRHKAIEMQRKIRHRGPDEGGTVVLVNFESLNFSLTLLVRNMVLNSTYFVTKDFL